MFHEVKKNTATIAARAALACSTMKKRVCLGAITNQLKDMCSCSFIDFINNTKNCKMNKYHS